MPKQKQLLKANNKKKGKAAQTELETADDFLAAGVEYEEAGEKWRAGDPVKSARFFVRAIETYSIGLQRFPQSFDLAYNKAHIQYELAQQPRLLQQLPTSFIDLLRLALDSHRFALNLGQENADLIFNTAQVLTSTAEALSEGGPVATNVKEEALTLFQEALGLFQRCLDLQEFQFTQANDQDRMTDEASTQGMEGSTLATSEASATSEDERWASIVEPVTRNTLLDTVIAQIETLTAFCNLMSSQGDSWLSWVEEFSHSLLEEKIPAYEASDRRSEISLVSANFASALADARFRSGRLDLFTYEREIADVFGRISDITELPQGLCDRADAILVFVASVYASVDLAELQAEDISRLNEIRWRHSTQALADLTAASKLPQVQNLPRIHLRRGDCELLRHRLGEAPFLYEVARKNSATLLKNAEVYYRGAAGIANAEGSVNEEQEARVKEALTAKLRGTDGKPAEILENNDSKLLFLIEEMREEGLLSDVHRLLGKN